MMQPGAWAATCLTRILYHIHGDSVFTSPLSGTRSRNLRFSGAMQTHIAPQPIDGRPVDK